MNCLMSLVTLSSTRSLTYFGEFIQVRVNILSTYYGVLGCITALDGVNNADIHRGSIQHAF